MTRGGEIVATGVVSKEGTLAGFRTAIGSIAEKGRFFMLDEKLSDSMLFGIIFPLVRCAVFTGNTT